MERYQRKNNESPFDFHKRLVYGKLVDKTLSDEDYVELAKYVYGKEYSSDVARRMMYGSRYTLELLDQCNQPNNKTQLTFLREKIGEMDVLKQQIRNEKNELGKIKREFIKSISVADEIKNYLEEHCTIKIPEYCGVPVEEYSDNAMIIHITDWHIGYVIQDCKGNYYNYTIARNRVDQLISECHRYIELFNITRVYVVITGDMIEQISMRKNQSQFCEFNQAVQVNKAIELIYYFVCAIAGFHCNVEVDMIYGNHDRTNGDITANLDGDNAEVIIREQLQKYVELTNNKRVAVVDRRHNDYEIIKEINGIKSKFIHGDKVKEKDDKKLIKQEMSLDNEFYDLLFKGHTHNHSITSENHGRYVITTGCLSGYNDFSVHFGCATMASQTIAIFGDRKVELIKDIILN